MPRKRSVNAFTIPEFLIAFGIGIILVGVFLSLWYFAYRNWTVERVRSRLRINLETTMERLKEEVRLSSATYMSGYPSGATTYTAISFPAATQDASGFYTLDSGFINWDKSVIYHLYDNPSTGNKELRRTEFTNNHDILIVSTQREAQLASVAVAGDGSSAPNSANAITTVILPHSASEKAYMDADFTVTPAGQGFDGYSEEETRVNVSFGSVNLDPAFDGGYHELKFAVIGKNDDSAGWKFGIDTLAITPSGCAREPEICVDHTDLLDTEDSHSSGDSDLKVGPNDVWSGRNYLEYNSDAVDDFITLRFYYDLWRDSNFDNSQRNNTLLAGDDLIIKLPDLDEGKAITWQAKDETGADADGYIAFANPIPINNITVRTIISHEIIQMEGDMVRVVFKANHLEPTKALKITSAYLDVRDGETWKCIYDSDDPSTYSSRVQLFFTTDPATGTVVDYGTGDITPDAIIPQVSYPTKVYSNWAIYPIEKDPDDPKDYCVTFHVANDIDNAHIAYWKGTAGETHSYLRLNDYAQDPTWSGVTPVDMTGGTVDPPDELPQSGGPECTISRHVYAVASIETWSSEGSVISQVYDTKITSPGYNTVRWTEHKPTNSSIAFKVASSATEEMSPDWDSITGFSDNPHTLSIANERYLQYRSDLAVTPLIWTCLDHSAVTVSDADYKSGAITCTSPGCGKYLVPQITTGSTLFPWIDNVTIDWPGPAKVCEISGYFVQRPDYGIISLEVDGQPLARSWNFTSSVTQKIRDNDYEASLSASVEPLNTGK
ncbi:MAG: hypothetical protein JW994_04455 [Candidatus Omnitrophica bacterium]|nr:hypothetical protein [Candidatus Omnitrophota bacterium]